MDEHTYAMIGKYFCIICAAAFGLAFFCVLYVAILGAVFWKFRRLRFLYRILMSVFTRQPKQSDYDHTYGAMMFMTMTDLDGHSYGVLQEDEQE